MRYSKITVVCGVCGSPILTVEAGSSLLSDSDIQMYQQGASCDQDGQSNIQVTAE